MKSRSIQLLLLLLFLTSQVYAQTTRLSNLGINDGLSQSMVSCILQDSRGFIWIGTGDGLNRYDGTQCIVYKNKLNDSASISNNTIRSIMEDPYGNVWIGTDGGLSRFDRRTNGFQHVIAKAYGAITPLFVEHDSMLWILVHAKGFGRYNILNGNYKTYYSKEQKDLCAYRGQWSQKPGMFRIAGNKGIVNLTVGPVSPVCVPDSLFYKVIGEEVVNDIIEDKHETWVSTNTRIICYDKQTGRFTQYAGMNRICKDLSGELWSSSPIQGLFLFDRKSQRFNRVSFDKDAATPVTIKTLYADHSGNLWIGTDGAGAYIYSPSCHKFKRYNSSAGFNNTTQKLSGDFIKCFATDDKGRVWVGTHDKGINILDLNANNLFAINNAWLSKQSVHTLYRDGSVMWIGTETGLYTCDLSTFMFREIYLAQDKPGVYHIRKLSNGSIAACTYNGLYLGESGRNTAFRKIPGTEYKSTYIYEDRNKKLWIATTYYTFSSLSPYTTTKREVLKSGALEVPDFAAKTFTEDAYGNLWIGGKKGLIKYDGKTNAQTIFTEQDGLPDAMVYGVLRDEQNRLWLSTNRGLSCFDPQTKMFTNYDTHDGLQSNEFNSGAYFKDDKGLMYFGGVSGFNVFDPLHFEENRRPPFVNLTGLKVFDLDYVSDRDYAELKEIVLHHSDNTLSFEFAAMDFSNPGKNHYAYMLEGADEGWIQSGTRKFARYANLHPGKYTFKVKATNNDGIWSDAHSLLVIRIAAPWWLTWWAISSGLLLSGAIVYLSVRYMIRQKLEKQLMAVEKLQAVNLERTRISKDMHDDLGSGLSRIAVMSELLKQQLQQNENEQVEKISKTASDLIDNMSHIIWAMNPENDHISNLLAYIREHAVEFLESCGLQCELHFPENTPELILTQEARRNVFLVVKESLNNIVKHASAGNVQITVAIKDRQLVLTIKDDGTGFDAAKNRKTGNGLRNMQKRMEQVQGTYKIMSEPGKGTITIISVFSA